MATYMELLRESAKTALQLRQAASRKKKLQTDIQSCIEKWLEANKNDIDSDFILGFIFPQTASQKPIHVVRKFEQKARPTQEPGASDAALKYVAKKMIETFDQHASADVSWSWPVLETYAHRFFEEFRQRSAKPGKRTEFMVVHHVASKTKTVGHANLSLSKDEPVYVVARIDMCPILNRMYNLLIDFQTQTETWRRLCNENRKLKDIVVADPTFRHKETVAIQHDNTIQNVRFSVRSCDGLHGTYMSVSAFVGSIRSNEKTNPTNFVSLLGSSSKSLDTHPFLAFLRERRMTCLRDAFKRKHPDKEMPPARHVVRISVLAQK